MLNYIKPLRLFPIENLFSMNYGKQLVRPNVHLLNYLLLNYLLLTKINKRMSI